MSKDRQIRANNIVVRNGVGDFADKIRIDKDQIRVKHEHPLGYQDQRDSIRGDLYTREKIRGIPLDIEGLDN